MPPVLSVNGRDLSPYVRVQHDAGLDPADSEYSEPQFSGSPAFREGQQHVGDAVGNREWTLPLMLKAATRAELHALIRNINLDLVRGASVRYATDSADDITHFDLESGRLDVQYEYWVTKANRVRAVLRLWTQPYGHTGTTRLVASSPATGPQRIVATGLLGDAPAQVRLEVTSEHIDTRFWAYGVRYPVTPSYRPIHNASQLTTLNPVASVFGASGRTASMYWGAAVNPINTAVQNLAKVDLLRGDHHGRHRVLLQLRHHLGPTAVGSGGGGPKLIADHLGVASRTLETVPLLASLVASSWQTVDLGEINVPTYGDIDQIAFSFVGASGATALATFPVRIDSVVLLPLDRQAGVLVPSPGAAGLASAISFDSVNRAAFELNSDVLGGIGNDWTSNLRGNLPCLPPVGSPGASGAAEIVLFQSVPLGASNGNFPHGLRNTAAVYVRERFRFLR